MKDKKNTGHTFVKKQSLHGFIFFLGLTSSCCYGQQTLPVDSPAVNFIVIGDWGHQGRYFQKPVAVQMGKTAAAAKVKFVISTGDNFYPHGVQSEYDSLWRRSFEDIYTAPALQVPWYPVLGNHDYHSNPGAQVAYTSLGTRWKMPARYYAKKINLGNDSTHQILLVFLDTNALIPRYYRGNKYNIHTEDAVAQKQWLEKTLAGASPHIKWKIVIGHHPMYTGGSRRYANETWPTRRALKRIFKRHCVDAYLAGHEHSLQHIGPIAGIHHFISGAGATRTRARKIMRSKFAVSDYGFMMFSATPNTLTVQVIDYLGKVLYATNLSN